MNNYAHIACSLLGTSEDLTGTIFVHILDTFPDFFSPQPVMSWSMTTFFGTTYTFFEV